MRKDDLSPIKEIANEEQVFKVAKEELFTKDKFKSISNSYVSIDNKPTSKGKAKEANIIRFDSIDEIQAIENLRKSMNSNEF